MPLHEYAISYVSTVLSILGFFLGVDCWSRGQVYVSFTLVLTEKTSLTHPWPHFLRTSLTFFSCSWFLKELSLVLGCLGLQSSSQPPGLSLSRGNPAVSNLFHLVTVLSAIIQTFPCTPATVSWLSCPLPSSLVPSPPPCVQQQHREELVSQSFSSLLALCIDHELTVCPWLSLYTLTCTWSLYSASWVVACSLACTPIDVIPWLLLDSSFSHANHIQ